MSLNALGVAGTWFAALATAGSTVYFARQLSLMSREAQLANKRLQQQHLADELERQDLNWTAFAAELESTGYRFSSIPKKIAALGKSPTEPDIVKSSIACLQRDLRSPIQHEDEPPEFRTLRALLRAEPELKMLETIAKDLETGHFCNDPSVRDAARENFLLGVTQLATQYNVAIPTPAQDPQGWAAFNDFDDKNSGMARRRSSLDELRPKIRAKHGL